MQAESKELVFENIKLKDLEEKIGSIRKASDLKNVTTFDVSLDEWFSTMFIDNAFEKQLLPLLNELTGLEVFRIDMGTGFAGKSMGSLCKILEVHQKLREVKLELSGEEDGADGKGFYYNDINNNQRIYFTDSEEFQNLTASLSSLKELESVTVNIAWNNISKSSLEAGLNNLAKLPKLNSLQLNLAGNYHVLENQEFEAKEVKAILEKVLPHVEDKDISLEFPEGDCE